MAFNPHQRTEKLIAGKTPQSVSAPKADGYTGFTATLTLNERGSLELRLPRRPNTALLRKMTVARWFWSDTRLCYVNGNNLDNQEFARVNFGIPTPTVVPVNFNQPTP